MSDRSVLEVIACSVDDAVQAQEGGASRLEVISHFESGGLTPPLGLVRDILSAVSLPVRAMLRETPGYTVQDGHEIDRLLAAARDLAALPIDGLVLGFLRAREIDVDLTLRILGVVPHCKATFHHAFEDLADPCRGIDELKGIGQIDRILIAGGEGDWPAKLDRLRLYEQWAGPELKILAGGGMTESTIQSIRGATGIQEFHVGRAARLDGAVHASRVRALANAAEAPN
jgi:copper homeostasis protein